MGLLLLSGSSGGMLKWEVTDSGYSLLSRLLRGPAKDAPSTKDQKKIWMFFIAAIFSSSGLHGFFRCSSDLQSSVDVCVPTTYRDDVGGPLVQGSKG